MNEISKTIEGLLKRIDLLETKNVSLEDRTNELEEKVNITAHVNSVLTKEVDRLNQYTRRSNLVIRKVWAPEEESVEQVEGKVREILKKMDLPKDVINDFDKAHRLGKVKETNGKKHQRKKEKN